MRVTIDSIKRAVDHKLQYNARSDYLLPQVVEMAVIEATRGEDFLPGMPQGTLRIVFRDKARGIYGMVTALLTSVTADYSHDVEDAMTKAVTEQYLRKSAYEYASETLVNLVLDGRQEVAGV